MTTSHRPVILLLLALSILLRSLTFFQVKTFGTDQARDVLLVKHHLEARQPFVLGPKASVGDFYLPPFYYYLITVPFLLMGGHPYAPAIFNLLVESFTPVLVFLFLAKFFQSWLAAAAGALYAVSPMAINYAGFAWNPNLIPFFSLVFLYFFFDYQLKGKDRALTPALVFATLAMQLHYQAFILFFFVGLMALYDLIVLKRAWRPWLKAVGAGALTFLPLLFDLGLTAVNLNRIVAYFTSVHSQIYQTTFTWPFIWDFISRFYGLILGYSHPTYFWARLVFIGGSIIIGLIGIKETFKSKTLSPYLLLMIFLACSLVGLRVYKGDKWEYFLSFMYYVPVMTIALSAALVFSKRAIIIFAISAFSAGLVFPPLSRPKSDDVAKLLYLNQQIESRYGDRIDLYNLYPYIDHAISYLWPQRAISGSAETIVAICPAKYRCHRPSSSIPTIAGSPIEQLLLDRSIQVSDTFVVDDLQAVAYQSL